jgi:prepilin-type processing-associated H-X9-DG protein/prepilin-type N-terminal cleavage/methylation domain-containing protein
MGRLHDDRRRRYLHGFTLVELMVVIGIIVLLVAILIPVLGHTRKNANNVKCLANVRSLGQGYLAYIAANRHPPAYYDPAVNPTPPPLSYAQTWIAALLESTTSTTNVCPEAKESPGGTVTSFGSASTAYGDPKTPYSFGSYGFNGYLYWANEPGQVANPTGTGSGPPSWSQGGRAGYKFANIPAGKKFEDYWFSDPLSADGGTVPQSVITALGGAPVPTTFGGAGSIPVFADANQYHGWPQDSDGTPSAGGYTVMSGDQSATYKLGRFCLARHPGGVNVVFLDGHATTVPLAQLWQLRWNKAFVPQTVSIP